MGGGGGHEYVFLAGAISGFAEGITIQVRRATQRALATCALLHAAALPQDMARPHAAAPARLQGPNCQAIQQHQPLHSPQPLEMLKTRFQINPGSHLKLLPTIREIIAEGGVRQLYRGARGGGGGLAFHYCCLVLTLPALRLHCPRLLRTCLKQLLTASSMRYASCPTGGPQRSQASCRECSQAQR